MEENAIINPRREKGEPVLPVSGLLCINPGDMKYLRSNLKELGAKQHFFFNSNLFTLPEDSLAFVAGPAVGAPMAVMALEKLIALGAKRIIVYGWCGSLTRRLSTGKLLLPTSGLSGEGTSRHYPIVENATSNKNLRNMLVGYLDEKGHGLQEGPIWTTDAPYRETRSVVKEYGQKGVLGVDMEFNALATVALYRKIELAAVYMVSDELWKEQWQPGYRHKEFLANNRLILDLLLKMICEMDGK